MSQFNRCLVAATIAAVTGATLAQPPVAQDSLKTTSRARAAKLMSARDIVTPLKDDGVEVTDITGQFPPEQLAAMRNFASFHGATDVYVFRLERAGDLIVAWAFLDHTALDANALFHDGSLRFQTSLLLPAHCTEYAWQQVVDALYEHGAAVTEDLSFETASTMSMLQTLRAQIELFTLQNDGPPNFADGWSALIQEDYIQEAPTSHLSTCADPTKLIVLTDSGKTGRDIMRGEAGWVWNEADHSLYVAGYGESDLDDLLSSKGRAETAIRNIRATYAMTGPDWAKEVSVKDSLGTVRFGLSRYRSMQFGGSKTTFPTLEELSQAKNWFIEVPANPYNGSNRIQQATWDADNPPVEGGAGWNYDPKTGKFWANTQTASANAF